MKIAAFLVAAAVFVLLAIGGALGQTPTPLPKATPAPDSPAGKELIEGRQVVVAAYSPLAQKYSEAYAAMQKAGGASIAGLDTKEAIAARRALIAACMAANADMLNFLGMEIDTLRTELAKVAMPPPKIEEYVAVFAPDPATPQIVQIRTLAQQTLKDMDDSLAVLDESFGRWKLGDGGHIAFKKPADVKKYGAAVDRIRKSIAAQTAAQAQLKANDLENAPSAATPAATPAS